MSNILYMWEYLQRKQEERIRGKCENRTRVRLALKLEGLNIIHERKKQEILKQAQQLVATYQNNQNDNGGGNAA